MTTNAPEGEDFIFEHTPEDYLRIPSYAPAELNVEGIKEMFDRLESLTLVLYFECHNEHGSDLTGGQLLSLYSQCLTWTRLGQNLIKHAQEADS